MQELFANNAITTLASNVLSTDTTISLHVGGGALFPNPTPGSQFFRLSLTSATTSATEIVFCTARTADVCTVIRAQEGTTALAFSTGDTVANQVTAGMMVNAYSPSADQQNVVRYAVETGTGNAFQVALNPALPAGVFGAEVMFKASHANTGAATIQINSGTIYPLVDMTGNALEGGEISNGSMVRIVWNGAGYSIIYSTASVPKGSLINYGRAVKTDYQDVTSSSWTDITNLTSSIAVVNAPVTLDASAMVYAHFNSAPWPAFTRLYLSGGEYGTGQAISNSTFEGFSGNTIGLQANLARKLPLSQNVTYTIKAQIRNSTSGATQNVRINATDESPTAATPDAACFLNYAIYKA